MYFLAFTLVLLSFVIDVTFTYFYLCDSGRLKGFYVKYLIYSFINRSKQLIYLLYLLRRKYRALSKFANYNILTGKTMNYSSLEF